MTELADVFAELEDPRAVNARRHSLHDIRFIALYAVISGGQTCSDMELFGHANRDSLQSFLELENGSGTGKRHSQPRHLFPDVGDAGSGGFSAVVPGVHGAVCRRHRGYGGIGWRPCAVLSTGPPAKPLRLVSAWAEERRLVLGQVAVDDKSKPALINLLQYGDLADPPAYEVLDRRVRGLFPTETARRIADELARRSD
ncbi:MAG: transposase family protein [Chloroflexi bacterium]|nr:transposase family protein [Chloroflexota bacterium]